MDGRSSSRPDLCPTHLRRPPHQGRGAAATALKLPEYQRLRDPEVLAEHLRRIDAGIANDPSAAIASSKGLGG
jgi:hypothetical protein